MGRNKKRRALELEALAKFYQLYGEFYSVWKPWTVYKDHPRYLVGYERDPETAWRLLDRAAEVEGGFEALLVRLAQERRLEPPEIDQLARFREAYQCLRESIRADRPLAWKANLAHGEAALQNQAFKRLASHTASLLSSPSGTSSLWRTLSPPLPSTAATTLLNATSVAYRHTWWQAPPEGGMPSTANGENETR